MVLDLVKQLKHFVIEQQLFQQEQPLLLAVSGGVDSVVLCDICHKAGYQFVIAHCNFKLRGIESDNDEIFVKNVAKNYGVPILVQSFNTTAYAAENKKSIQVAARELRYNWFVQIANNGTVELLLQQNKEVGASIKKNQLPTCILTAHHANDSIETLLMNFFKGTGIKGLQGIIPKQQQLNNIIRPLLFATKQQIVQYASQNDITYIEDASNATDKYTRNYFRNQLIPSISTIFPKVEENLIDNVQRFSDIQVLYNQSIQLHKKNLIVTKGNEIHIPTLKLQKTQPITTVLYEIIKEYGFTAHQTKDVLGLINSSTGKFVQSQTHQAIKNRNWLIIAPIQTTTASTILIKSPNELIQFAAGKLTIQSQANAATIKTLPTVAQLNAAAIQFPLLLRTWKQGDYFYPLGMQKKKKLSKFFIDQKLSLVQKEKIWVIEMDKKIIWVIGLRIDDRFKVNNNTSPQLLITFESLDASI
jgi:tRNA(Ile)-lysidine synthase